MEHLAVYCLAPPPPRLGDRRSLMGPARSYDIAATSILCIEKKLLDEINLNGIDDFVSQNVRRKF